MDDPHNNDSSTLSTDVISLKIEESLLDMSLISLWWRAPQQARVFSGTDQRPRKLLSEPLHFL